MLSNIRTSFDYIDKAIVRKRTIITIKSKLEDAEMAWSSHKTKHIGKLKRFQRRANKLVSKLKEILFKEKLLEMTLLSL